MKILKPAEFQSDICFFESELNNLEKSYLDLNNNLLSIKETSSSSELDFLFNPLIDNVGDLKMIVDIHYGYLTSLKEVKKSYVSQTDYIVSEVNMMTSRMRGDL